MKAKFLFATLLCCAPVLGDAKPVYRGRVSLTGFLYSEDDGVDPAQNTAQRIATNSKLGFVDLRATAVGTRLLGDRLDFKIDFRVRVTGSLDFERTFDPNSKLFGDDLYKTPLGLSARGYLGGREYDLREAYVVFRPKPSWQLSVGRQYVAAADAAKIDGVRLSHDFGPRWTGLLFAGGYPNPYSRSLLNDYAAPCGAGVAGSRNEPPSLVADAASPTADELAAQRCQASVGRFGLLAGVGGRYTYNTMWGTFGAAGSVFFGPGDGGPVVPNFSAAFPQNSAPIDKNLLPPSDALDAPRVFLSWFHAWRPHERIDLMSDLVVDLYGSAGPQLTRAVVMSSIRALSDDRLTVRIGYSHMSSLAINMYLSRLLYNRTAGTTLTAIGASAVENNLTVLRTGRDEGRLTIDSRLFRRLGGFAEGRFRSRHLINGSSNPDVYTSPDYLQNASNLAGDVSVGLRDTGTLKRLRASLIYSLIFDFRSLNHVVTFDLGREFWDDRLSVTVGYNLAITSDKLARNDSVFCTSAAAFTCFGKREGKTHEASAQITLNPWRTLFFLAEYRLIVMTSATRADLVVPEVPTVFSHGVLFRSEFRF